MAEAVERKAHALSTSISIARNSSFQDRTLAVRNQATIDTLVRADSYWIAKDIWNAVVESARDLPLDFVFSEDVLPSQFGWIWLEEPWNIPGSEAMLEYAADKTELSLYGACAISWGIGQGLKGEGAVLAIETFHRSVDGQLIPLFYTFASPLRSIAEEEQRRGAELISGGRGDDVDGLNAIMRSVIGLFLWVKQTICTSKSVGLERYAASRLAHLGMNKALNVIVLRRSEREQHIGTGDDVDTEWSCRWLVRGHWRRQYYPSKKEREPIYILPHVKGPDDKPFKAPSHTVYQVSR